MNNYHLTAIIWKEGRHYVSKCPELGVASYGPTPEKAKQALEEAVSLFLSNAKKLHLMNDLKPTLSAVNKYTAPLDIAA